LVKEDELLLDLRGSSPDQEPGAVPAVRILLLESDHRAARLVTEMLRAGWDEGVLVAQAERLADATQELLDRGADAVLLGRPPADGDALGSIEQLRTAAPDVPLVVLSDRVDDEEMVRAIKAGAQDCLVKSELHPAALRRALRSAIERNRAEAKLAHQALHDPLTGLPNRALFLDRLGVALDRSRRSGGSIAVLFLDVDNFKRVNDSLGHAAGDRLLAALADRMRTMLRPMDTVARFGGDEFTFLFEDLASEREVVLIAERVNNAAMVPISLEDREARVTVSIGIAVVSDPAVAAETVIREADAAMYRAKELGRSRYELFDEASRRRAMERLELETALRHAVDRRELEVHYQPGVSLEDGDGGVIGLEALVRWQHPERGLLAPGEFIPLAEDMGLILPIGQFVLEQALTRIARWRRYKPEMTVSVNVSFRQLEDMSLVSTLAGAIRTSALEPEALCIEVAESAVTQNPEVAIRALRALKGMGVRVAIDDFGTGSSSLSNLKRLPVDTLKIHESVLSGLGSDPSESPIVGAVVELGHALGLRVMAEGVETDAQLAELRTLGCDAAQGFLFGRPMPEADIQALLVSHGGDPLPPNPQAIKGLAR
jgi:diguanylate cyclase (GGDEF)-like protein